MQYSLRTPVALFIYNRPQLTQKIFKEIARARPSKLLVIADGPRSGDDLVRCEAARKIINRVDWNCEVLKNFSPVNLGCKRRMSSGLDWIFARCDEAIILEDDTFPHPTFFRFCSELLEKYKNDERVMMIGGSNFQFGRKVNPYNYYFSHYALIWGWATWRRAWSYFDLEMKSWPALRNTSWLFNILGDRASEEYWHNIFDSVYAGHIDTWDYQWVFACLVQRGLDILPNVNLVSNIGFGQEATHTRDANNLSANLPVTAMAFPIQHPDQVVRDKKADQFTFEKVYKPKPLSFYNYLRRKCSLILPSVIKQPLSILFSKRAKIKKVV